MLKNEYVNPYNVAYVSSSSVQFKLFTLYLTRDGIESTANIEFDVTLFSSMLKKSSFSLYAKYNGSKIDCTLHAFVDIPQYLSVAAAVDSDNGNIEIYASVSYYSGARLGVNIQASDTYNYVVDIQESLIPASRTIVNCIYKEPVITYATGVSHNNTYPSYPRRQAEEFLYTDVIYIDSSTWDSDAKTILTTTNTSGLVGNGQIVGENGIGFLLFRNNTLTTNLELTTGYYSIIFNASSNNSSKPTFNIES